MHDYMTYGCTFNVVHKIGTTLGFFCPSAVEGATFLYQDPFAEF